MNLLGLALKNIVGNAFRSTVVVVCVLLVAGFSLSTTLVIRGAEESLRLAMDRMGADIVVIPKGLQSRVETALLTGKPTTVWMPADNLARVQAVPGVAQASPQTYLASLNNASCCAVSEMFMVTFDPKTDFTVQPWLERRLGHGLGLGEALGGSLVSTPEGEEFLMLFGYFLTLKATLEPTGTGMDQTLFITMDTAHDMALVSRSRAEKPLEIPTDSISAVLVRVAPGASAHDVSQQIARDLPNVSPVEGLDLFRTFRRQMTGLRSSMSMALAASWILSILLVGLLFSITANERRRETGVLRALGSTCRSVFFCLLLEAAILSLGGGLLGTVLAAATTFLFRDLIVNTLGMPFLFPTWTELGALFGVGLLVALVGVAVAVLAPALSVSRQDPAAAMRE